MPLNQDTACVFLDFTSQFALQGFIKLKRRLKRKKLDGLGESSSVLAYLDFGIKKLWKFITISYNLNILILFILLTRSNDFNFVTNKS